MSAHSDPAHLSVGRLAEYWLGELTDVEELAAEEHLFACAACADTLAKTVELGDAVRTLMKRGAVASILTAGFVARLKRSGLRVREYRMGPGGSVNCTIAPHDDLAVAHLSAALDGVRQVDLVFEDGPAGMQARLVDVPFTPEGIVLAPNSDHLRTLKTVAQRVQLLEVAPTGERLLAEYEFRHSPFEEI